MNMLATVGLKAPVDYTIINGRITVENGRVKTIDEDRLSADSRATVARYLSGERE